MTSPLNKSTIVCGALPEGPSLLPLPGRLRRVHSEFMEDQHRCPGTLSLSIKQSAAIVEKS